MIVMMLWHCCAFVWFSCMCFTYAFACRSGSKRSLLKQVCGKFGFGATVSEENHEEVDACVLVHFCTTTALTDSPAVLPLAAAHLAVVHSV